MNHVPPRRIWRLRKLHQYVDAVVVNGSDSSAVELRFLLNGELSYAQPFSSFDSALAEAAARRAELERDGWTFHW